MTAAITELIRRRRVLQVWRCGPRALAELLDEIGHERSIATLIDNKLERCAQLDPRILRAVGADQMPPAPLSLAVDADGDVA